MLDTEPQGRVQGGPQPLSMVGGAKPLSICKSRRVGGGGGLNPGPFASRKGLGGGA